MCLVHPMVSIWGYIRSTMSSSMPRPLKRQSKWGTQFHYGKERPYYLWLDNWNMLKSKSYTCNHSMINLKLNGWSVLKILKKFTPSQDLDCVDLFSGMASVTKGFRWDPNLNISCTRHMLQYITKYSSLWPCPVGENLRALGSQVLTTNIN